MKNEETFNNEDYNSTYPDGIQFNYWNLARNQYIYNKMSKLNTKNNILDIGCGRGIIVDFLRERNLNCYGVELGKSKPITEKIEKYIFPETDVFALSKDFSDSIETIMFLDVLEHIEEPEKFLEKCINHFKNLKYIFLTLPARQELWTNYDDYYGHYLRYDYDSCKKLINQFSFQNVTIGYFFHLLYIPMIFTRFFKINRTIKQVPPKTRIQKLFHRILGKIFYLDSLLIPKSIPGSSVSITIKI